MARSAASYDEVVLHKNLFRIFFASYRGTSRAFAALLTRSHTVVCSLVRALQKHNLRTRYFAKLFGGVRFTALYLLTATVCTIPFPEWYRLCAA